MDFPFNTNDDSTPLIHLTVLTLTALTCSVGECYFSIVSHYPIIFDDQGLEYMESSLT